MLPAAIITGILGPLIVLALRYFLQNNKNANKKKQQEFDFIVKNQDIINNRLNILQEELGLDRVWVCQFHNGGNFWPGNQSMKKLSVIFESTDSCVSTDIMKMQNIPVSFFSGLIQQFVTENKNFIELQVEKIKDNALRSYWSTRGVECVYLYPIYCMDQMLVGLMGVEQTNTDKRLTNDTTSQLCDESKKLSGYIANVVVKRD